MAIAAERPLSIVVVDDHPMVRDVVKFACLGQPDLHVAGEAGDGEDAVAVCARLRPDVLVLDLALPRADGFEVLRRLGETSPATRTLVLSGTDSDRAVFDALRAGVAGYLSKSASLVDILEAIRTVGRGGRAFPPGVERHAHTRLADLAHRARVAAQAEARLTPREREVLRLISGGMTSRQIASSLGISERTVESYVGGVFDKLGVRTRAQAVREALRLCLVDVA
jgi:DNA-binding NarL/FixJ family response regulator